MTQARPIPQKVVRLVPMLGSTVDHEALSAARAIGRVLDREGLGFTDLANAIATGETRSIEAAPAPRPDCPRDPIPPFNVYAFRRSYTPRQEVEHRARVRFCQDRAWRLTDWERGFLNNIARQHGNLTIRQGDLLAALTDRLDMEARRA
ncbi:hypothetical protein [Methylobacterium longum]|uniref:Uncharacterized protein n=1 Tax=Methylobacterium longum TaxID=767694 RepID=A0ABT8AYL0_9HYPH|nr:hypothetical protein [Methylobacterium longum]MDN3575072.1 hypothetical protein [Methylobacterium longum]GJE14783.1 hypothetical protein FOHLNKBM_5858 [Methylobacterium longum]